MICNISAYKRNIAKQHLLKLLQFADGHRSSASDKEFYGNFADPSAVI